MAYNDFAVDRKALIEDIIEVLGTAKKLNLIINYILLTSYIKHKKHLTFI